MHFSAAHPEMEFVQLQINYADWENAVIQIKSLLRGSQKTWKTGHYHGTCKRRHACNSAGSSGKASEGSRAGSGPQASWAIRFAANLEGADTPYFPE